MHTFNEWVDRMPRPLWWASLLHVGIALFCLVLSATAAAPVLGVHRALKPLKFAVSIALFLATMGVLIPCLSISPTTKSVLAWVFVLTMLAEMLPIMAQALRGTTSHFNVRGAANSALWNVMFVAIVLATLARGYVALVAALRPLLGPAGVPFPSLMTFAWRAGLVLLLLTPVSGFAMGSRAQHSVGGQDGGIGLPFFNWSTQFGDLRVSHFFALHAVQLLPMLAWRLLRLFANAPMRWAVLVTTQITVSALCVGTLVQALAGRPFVKTATVAESIKESALP